MNRVAELLLGAVMGLLCCLLGTWIFISCFTDYGFSEGVAALRAQGSLGKLISLGAVLNIVAFFTLLKYNKDLLARGVILSLFIIAIVTVSLMT